MVWVEGTSVNEEHLHRMMIEYLLVMPAHTYDIITLGALRSLKKSDYEGTIVVVSPDVRTEMVKEIDSDIDCIVTAGMYPPDTMYGTAVTKYRDQLTEDSIIIISHNDCIYPTAWFIEFQHIFDKYWEHIWCLTFPFYAMNQGSSTGVEVEGSAIILNQWVSGDYSTMYPVAKDKLRPYPIDTSLDKLLTIMTNGVYVAGAGIKYSIYSEVLDKYGYDTYFLSDDLCLLEAITRRQWNVSANICPLIHLACHDTLAYSLFNQTNNASVVGAYDHWFKIFGYNLECVKALWNRNTTYKHGEDIVNAIRSNKWAEIEHYFTDIESALKGEDCAVCPANDVCYYVGKRNTPRI